MPISISDQHVDDQLLPENRYADVSDNRVPFWPEKLEFVTEVHRHIKPAETAYSIANESRRLLHCDRVSVARWNGRRCKITAISSQDRFDNRANVVRKLGRIASSSVSSDTTYWVTGSTDGIAPKIQRQIADYLDESHSRTFAVVPIFAPVEPNPPTETGRRRRQRRPRRLGAVIIEYFDEEIPQESVSETTDLIVEQSQIALENARIHGDIFLLPVWQRLGWLQKLMFRDHLAKSLTGLTALLILTLLMIFYPKELKMKVSGVMRPSQRQTIFAQSDGIIREVAVDQGTEVKQGDLLLRLENSDLELQIAEAHLQMETLQHQLNEASLRLSHSRLEDDEKFEVSGTIRLLKIRQTNLIEQMELMQHKKDLLRIASPIDGTVITPQPERRLINFPANPSLRSVASDWGSWRMF